MTCSRRSQGGKVSNFESYEWMAGDDVISFYDKVPSNQRNFEDPSNKVRQWNKNNEAHHLFKSKSSSSGIHEVQHSNQSSLKLKLFDRQLV